MQRTKIKDLRQAIGQTVKLQGWLQTLRDQKKMQFLVVRDASGLVQVVFEKQANAALAELISSLTPESVVTLTGRVVDNPIVKLGGLELQLGKPAGEFAGGHTVAARPNRGRPAGAGLPPGLALPGSAPT